MASRAAAELGLLPWREGGVVNEFEQALRNYLRNIAKRGGSVKGPSKRRGDSEYYSRIARMRKPKKPAEPPAEEPTP